MQEIGILTLKYRLLGLETCECGGVKNDDFSMFGDLEGDFCKETYEPKLFGMHVRSVLSGLYAETLDTDPKMSIQLMFWGWESVRVEGRK